MRGELLIMIEHLLKTIEIEAIPNVLFIYFAKKLMVL